MASGCSPPTTAASRGWASWSPPRRPLGHLPGTKIRPTSEILKRHTRAGRGAVAERREDLRAADVDRQFVAERLKSALDEGRLDLHEYDERLQNAYAAKTYGDLDKVLSDLPGFTPVGHSQVVPSAADNRYPTAVARAELEGKPL